MSEPSRVDSPPSASTVSVPVPPAATSAEDVNAWWNSLDEQDRARLIAEHPPRLGNLNGIPPDVRDRVNTAAMHDDLARVEDATRNGVSVDEVLEDPVRRSQQAVARRWAPRRSRKELRATFRVCVLNSSISRLRRCGAIMSRPG